jgi:hypothetical protein
MKLLSSAFIPASSEESWPRVCCAARKAISGTSDATESTGQAVTAVRLAMSIGTSVVNHQFTAQAYGRLNVNYLQG